MAGIRVQEAIYLYAKLGAVREGLEHTMDDLATLQGRYPDNKTIRLWAEAIVDATRTIQCMREEIADLHTTTEEETDEDQD